MVDIDIETENMINKYPKPISIEGTKTILKQMENNICKVYKIDGEKGTGFFCNIFYNNISIPVMITNNHVIDEEYIKNNKEIQITLNDDKDEKVIILNDNRKIYTNKEYDTTIIEIKPELDKINSFMELDEKIYKKSNILYNNESIYIIQYSNGEKAVVSYGIINNIKGYNIIHYCRTKPDSSGSPIINLLNNKIIGIHKDESIHFNKGTYLKYPINDFINKILNESKINNNNIINNNKDNNFNEKNEIEIEIKIDAKEINKKIYFLDNTDYIEHKSNIKHLHDNLKELNELNTELYINNNKYKYEKYFKPDRDGIFKIKLKFKINIKDCSFMFAGCKNIININFKNFNTKNIINMRYMFTGCINIEYLDLSSFDTSNVKDMEGMFGEYNNFSCRDFPFFDILNISKDFNKYYLGCKKLKEVNISSFNTKSVNNMSFLFCNCINLTNLNLSSFDTKNVTKMTGMFSGCKKLTNLNLSSFDTKNVTNMSFMFGE